MRTHGWALARGTVLVSVPFPGAVPLHLHFSLKPRPPFPQPQEEFLIPSTLPPTPTTHAHLTFAWQEPDLRGFLALRRNGSFLLTAVEHNRRGAVHTGHELFYIYKDRSGCCAVKDEKKEGFPREGERSRWPGLDLELRR